MATRPTIEIKFQAKGAEGLRKSIEKLGTAQNRFNKSTYKASGTQDKFTAAQKRSTKAGSLAVRNLRNQKKSVNTLNGSFSVLRSKLLLVSFGFSLIVGSIGKALQMFGFQERAIAKLNTQLGFNSTKLQEQASTLQQVTGVGDEVIINAQSQLAAFVRNEEAIGKLTEAALNLSAGLGIDLNSSSQLLGKTIGSTTNAMSRYGISVTGAANSSDRINSAIQNTNALFGGLAKAAGEQTLGSLDRLSASFGDLIEAFGKLLAATPIIPFIEAITWSFGIMGEEIKRASETMSILTSAVHGGVEANDELAKSTNKQIMSIKSLVNLETARDRISQIEREIAAEKTLIQSINATNIANNKTVAVNNSIVDVTQKVNDVILTLDGQNYNLAQTVDDTTGAINSQNSIIMDLTDGTNDFNDVTNQAVINIGNQGKAFQQVDSQITKLNTTKGVHLDVTKKGLEATDELARLMMLLSMLMSKENDLAAKQISQIQNRNISANNLAVAQGKLTKHQAALNNINEKKIAVDEMLDKGFINEIQYKDIINKLNLETINTEKQLQQEKMKSATMMIDSIQEVTSTLVSNLDKRQQAGMQSLKEENRYINASNEQKKILEDNFNKEYQNKRNNLFRAEQALSISEIIINTLASMSKAEGQMGMFGIPLATYFAAQGAIRVGLVAAQKPPAYEYGGLIGGMRHSSGGTLIEAEQGEFVMNRNAVDSIGVGTLNAMNKGGGGVTVNVSGNVLTQDFVEGELAESIQEAVRKGVSFA